MSKTKNNIAASLAADNHNEEVKEKVENKIGSSTPPIKPTLTDVGRCGWCDAEELPNTKRWTLTGPIVWEVKKDEETKEVFVSYMEKGGRPGKMANIVKRFEAGNASEFEFLVGFLGNAFGKLQEKVDIATKLAREAKK